MFFVLGFTNEHLKYRVKKIHNEPEHTRSDDSIPEVSNMSKLYYSGVETLGISTQLLTGFVIIFFFSRQ